MLTSTGAAANIVLDLILSALHLGVRGAAIATVLVAVSFAFHNVKF